MVLDVSRRTVQGKCVAVSILFPKGFLTSECADGVAKDVGLLRLTSLQRARVPGGAACLAQGRVCASSNGLLCFRPLAVPWQDGQAFPWPRRES